MRTAFLTAAVLAALAVSPDTASAQFRGRYYGGGYARPAYGGYYGGGYARPYYYNTYRPAYGGYYGGGYTRPYYYSNPGFGFSIGNGYYPGYGGYWW